MPTKKLRLVQIAVAACCDADGNYVDERLYALDSTGTLWWWRDETRQSTAGWERLDLPWENRSEKKELKG